MTDQTTAEQILAGGAGLPPAAPGDEFAAQIADQVESFLIALRAVAAEGDAGRSISLLLLEISQILLAGARLGAQVDFTPEEDYQPDVGPDADLDGLGNTAEALWWWQFSYVSSWGNLAGAMLNALLSVVAHDRLDVEFTGELDQVAAANEMLESPPEGPQ